MIGCHPYRDECFLWDRFPGYRCARPGANGFNASSVEICATSKSVGEGALHPARLLAYSLAAPIHVLLSGLAFKDLHAERR